MKGQIIIIRGIPHDVAPCYGCKHRNKSKDEYPCNICVSDDDVSKPNYATNFTAYEYDKTSGDYACDRTEYGHIHAVNLRRTIPADSSSNVQQDMKIW